MKQGIFISYRWIAIVIAGLTAIFWSVSIITAQPPIPHTVPAPADLEIDCLSCHQAGVADAPRLAWDHLGRSNEDCVQCHAVSGNMAVPIKHTLEGRDQCYDCHLDGSSGSPRVAGNHASYAVDTCQMCHPHEEVKVVETRDTDEGPHRLYGLDAGKTCLKCHRQQFANDDHSEMTEVAQLREWRPAKGMYLWAAYCARCHGTDGKTELFPIDTTSTTAIARSQVETEEEEEFTTEDTKSDETEAETEVEVEEAEEAATDETETEEAEEAATDETETVTVEHIPGSGLVINTPAYLGIRDDAQIMQAIMANPNNPEHIFTRVHDGPLKFDDVINIVAYIRTWGALEAKYNLPTPSFSEDVYPLIQKECGGQCHLDKQKGGWSMASYEEMMTTGENAPTIIPNDPDSSLLAQKLQNKQKIGEIMPPDSQLSSDQISIIIEWIRAGAPGDT